mmetsp:Transcript_19739/g.54304  ORF Transcript_19739/g.54304 Transcript_19739/m.54304 type:complete len:161 (-) Transcript_19739:202-684(-)
MRAQLGGGMDGGSGYNGGGGAASYGGNMGHRLMCPPVGYKFIPRRKDICNQKGCFECYDIYCERCESKDRRIIELEMRNNELVKHITLLQARLFPRTEGGGGPNGGGAAGANGPGQGGGQEPFAYVQSPVLYDQSLGISYQATTTFNPVGGQSPSTPRQP